MRDDVERDPPGCDRASEEAFGDEEFFENFVD